MPVFESNIGRKGPNFIIEMGGQHDVTMKQVTASAAFVEGEVVADDGGKLSSTSTGVMGIATQDCQAGDVTAFLVAGQPTTVDYHLLTYGDGSAVEADVDKWLAAKQIMVVQL